MTRTLPSLTSGASVSDRSRASLVIASRSLRSASARFLACGLGKPCTVGVPELAGTATYTVSLPANALSSEAANPLYLPSLTTEMAYMTTKKANSSVMKSAYEISQRSWFSLS